MKQLILNFPQQLEEALTIGQSYLFKTPVKPFKNVVLTGLGGSGIGGSIVQNYVADKMAIPFLVNKDYHLPAYVGEDTLVIASSYSGNTEETVMAMQAALDRKATVVCITSGGKIAEMAKAHALDCILMPGGMPPRACLGYSLVQVLFVLLHFRFIDGEFREEIQDAISLIKKEASKLEKAGKDLAEKLVGKIPVIYCGAQFDGLGVRVRQQLNENSKVLGWSAPIPEMNHNELVGWAGGSDDYAVILLRSPKDFERVQMRMEINKTIFEQYTKNVIEVTAKGSSYFEELFYLVHLTDWTSYYLSELRGVDATEVKVIDFLKGELAKK